MRDRKFFFLRASASARPPWEANFYAHPCTFACLASVSHP